MKLLLLVWGVEVEGVNVLNLLALALLLLLTLDDDDAGDSDLFLITLSSARLVTLLLLFGGLLLSVDTLPKAFFLAESVLP